MELTIPFAALVTTWRRNWGSRATTSPAQRDVCCQGKKIAASASPTIRKKVTREMNLANQLDRTKCMAGNRSPSDFVGRNRIMRREASGCVALWAFADLPIGVSVAIF